MHALTYTQSLAAIIPVAAFAIDAARVAPMAGMLALAVHVLATVRTLRPSLRLLTLHQP
jgi:hypothetical protein